MFPRMRRTETEKMRAMTMPIAVLIIAETARDCRNAIMSPMQTTRMTAKEEMKTSPPRVGVGLRIRTSAKEATSTTRNSAICTAPWPWAAEMNNALRKNDGMDMAPK